MVPRPPPPQSSTGSDVHVEDPARLLITGPPGSGKTREAMARVDAAIREAGANRVLLVLPTYGDVEHAKRTALSRGDGSPGGEVRGLLDAPYATFTSLAERLYPEYHVRVLPSRVERDLLAGEALKRAAVPAFEAVRDRAGFRSRFLRLVKEMKQTGEEPGALRERARKAAAGMREAPRERLEGFLAAWEVYDGLLVHAGVPDHEDVLRRLLGTLRKAPPAMLRDLALLAVDGFEDLSGLESALLDAATDAITAGGGRVVVTLPWDTARSELFVTTAPLKSHLLASRGFVERPLTGFPRSGAKALSHLAEHLFRADEDALPPADAGEDVQSIVGADPMDEIDRIGREILKLREATPPVAFREVGIVFRRLDAIGVPARRAFERLGIPTRLVGAGARLASEPVVRALRGPLRLLAGDDGTGERDFDAALLLDYFRWRALASGEPITIDVVDTADIEWREKGFPGDWAEFRARILAKDDAGASAAVHRLESLRIACAAAVGPTATWGAITQALEALLPLPSCGGFLESGRPKDPTRDERVRRAGAARSRLLALAGELRRAADTTHLFPELNAETAVGQLVEACAAATGEPADRRLDAVSLLDAEEARHWELPVVFVAGLVEREFPLHPREDVFLRDEDRAAMKSDEGSDLGTLRDAEIGERRLFLSAVTRAKRRVYLCRSAATEDGRERSPSFFWKDVGRCLVGRDAGGSPRALHDASPDIARSDVPPAEAVCPDDLLHFAASSLGALPLPRGEADRRRAVALFREGGVEAASVLERAARFRRPAADPLEAGSLAAFMDATRVVSPTQATTALVCPHRFFLSRVAKVPEDAAPFGGPGFGRRDLGELVHEALKRAVDDPKRKAEVIADEVLEKNREYLPDSAIRDWVGGDIVRIVRLFRDREAVAAESKFAPRPGDVEFKLGDLGLAVEIGSGAGVFQLSGQFDRLDTGTVDGRESAIVVDYKLGVSTAEKSSDELRDLEDLQLLLYARAVEKARGVPVVGLELYAAAARRRFATYDASAEAVFAARREGKGGKALASEEFRALLSGAESKASDAIAGVRGDGGHVKRPLDADRCTDCSWKPVCRPDVLRFRSVEPPS